MVGGLVYVSTALGQVAALDAGTGEAVWTYDPRSYDRIERPANIGWQHRGVSYWDDADSDDARIVIATHDLRLIALDARTGALLSQLRRERHRRSQRESRARDRPLAHHPLDAGRRRARHARRREHADRPDHDPRGAAGARPRVRRAHRRPEVDLPHDSSGRRLRGRFVAGTSRGATAGTPMSGATWRSTKSWATSTCRSVPRPTTGMAACAPATISSPRASCVSMPKRACGSGTSRRCTTACGTTTSRRAGTCSISPSRDATSRPLPRRASRRSPTSSTGQPASRSGRLKNDRCRRATRRVSGTRRRSRFRPSRRRSTCRASRSMT